MDNIAFSSSCETLSCELFFLWSSDVLAERGEVVTSSFY